MDIKTPEGAKVKVTLDTGRVLFFRESTFRDMRLASEISTKSEGNFDAWEYVMEIVKSTIIALHRKNGEAVDINNREKLFDEILTKDEGVQIILNPETVGINLKKNPPKMEML